MKLRYLLIALMVSFVLPQLSKAQLVKENLTKMVFSDQFDEDKGNWKNAATADNLFLIQDGEYLLRRKNAFSGYSIFTSWKNKLEAYSLVASMKLEEVKTEDASIGLIFMAQEDGSGAFVFEFNQKAQFRLKQLVGINFKLLTGDAKSNGWMSTDLLNPVNQYNQVEVRTSKKNYDIYLNQKYLLSFQEPAYRTGDMGIALGPSTKARIDFINVYEAAPEQPKVESPPPAPVQKPVINPEPTHTSTANNPPPVAPKKEVVREEPTVVPTNPSGSTDALMKLIDQVTKLSMENQQLRDSLRILRKQLRK